jgi:hypothetical protein
MTLHQPARAVAFSPAEGDLKLNAIVQIITTIKPVVQEETTGCGIASVANIIINNQNLYYLADPTKMCVRSGVGLYLHDRRVGGNSDEERNRTL